MRTLLLIEDNAEILDNFREYLQLEGFRVLAASNGKAGVSLAKKYLPDLIICDIFLPGMNGYRVLRILNAHPVTTHIPLIFNSCLSESRHRVKAFKLGACDYLTKPFEMETLVKVIEKHIDNFALIANNQRE